jgi:hypothetical protein
VEAENGGPESVQLGDTGFDEYVPERWETVVEDLAQVVALGLDRAQDLADAVNDFTRGHPTLIKSSLAAIGGVVVGLFVADRLRPRPPTLAERSRAAAEGAAQAAREGVERAQRAAAQAAAAAQSAAEGVSPRIRGRLHWQPETYSSNGQNGRGRGPAKSAASATSQARYAAELAPLAVALLRNPLVRDFLMRAALRAAQRRTG